MQISTKLIFLFFCLALSMQAAKAQFYYNDIVLTRQAREKWKIYQQAKVKSVNIMSMDAANEPAEGFTCEQQTGARRKRMKIPPGVMPPILFCCPMTAKRA